jgi:two-component sensor histidine kinase
LLTDALVSAHDAADRRLSISQVIPIRPDTAIEYALIHEASHRGANHLALLAGMVQVQATKVAKGPALVSRDDVQAILREVAGKVIGMGHPHEPATIPA